MTHFLRIALHQLQQYKMSAEIHVFYWPMASPECFLIEILCLNSTPYTRRQIKDTN